MFRVCVISLLFVVFGGGVQSTEAGERPIIQIRGFAAGGQERNADEPTQVIRRERMREIRQEMLRQREEGVGPAREPLEPRNLRRLTPEERQRLRRDLREAYKQR